MNISFTGKIITLIDLSPARLWLGEVKPDTKVLSGEFTLTNAMSAPLGIRKIIPPSNRVKTRLVAVTQGQAYRILIDVYPPYPEGTHDEKLVIITDNKNRPELNANYGYYLAPALEVMPQVILVYKNDNASPFTKSVVILNRMSGPASVTGISVTDKRIKTGLKEPDRGKSFEITLDFPAGFTVPAGQAALLQFQIRTPAVRNVTIPIRMAE
jgi:hypothetical protein